MTDLVWPMAGRGSWLRRWMRTCAPTWRWTTSNVIDLTVELGACDVVFLAALVGMASEENVDAIAYLGKHMADGAALIMQSVHGAQAFLYPIVDLDDVKHSGYGECLELI